MIRVFEYTDPDGSDLTIEVYTSNSGGVWVTTRREGGAQISVHLDPGRVSALRAALRPYEEVPDSERADAYAQGYAAAFAARNREVEELEGRLQEGQAREIGLERELAGAKEVLSIVEQERDALAASQLDRARVEALEKAAEVAKGLRSVGPLSSGVVSHETVLAYALFLLDKLPMPEAQQ